MDRLEWLLLVGAVALVVAAMGAGPAAAAKGGNSQNAKLCQKGGFADLNDATTGLRFTSQDACVSYGAKGNTYSSLRATDTVGCGGGCWGTVSGSGLQPAPRSTSSSRPPHSLSSSSRARRQTERSASPYSPHARKDLAASTPSRRRRPEHRSRRTSSTAHAAELEHQDRAALST